MSSKRHGGDHRGSAQSRRNRKMRMLRVYGNGETCNCVHCGCSVNFDTIEADRIIPGGPYAFFNVQPSCRSCNCARSDNANWQYVGAMA